MSAPVLFLVLGLLLIALGWPMAARRVRPNRWYGLRVPATFADEQVWYDANAVAGRDLMALGAVVVALALVLPRLRGFPEGAVTGVCTGVLAVGPLFLAFRGWRVANRLLRERRGDHGTG